MNFKMINKKMVAMMMLGMLTVSQLVGSAAVYANNYKDSSYSFDYNGDGSDVYTSKRRKMDSSAAYINNSGSGTHSVTVDVTNGNYKNCSSYYVVKSGCRKYIKNTVYKGKSGTKYYARLAMGTTSGKKGVLKGVWSPDNCSGY